MIDSESRCLENLSNIKMDCVPIHCFEIAAKLNSGSRIPAKSISALLRYNNNNNNNNNISFRLRVKYES
jgi:hypothetical protein